MTFPSFHYDLPFIPLRYNYAPFTSSSQFTSLPFNSFLMIAPTPLLRLIYPYLTLFLKLLDLQERVPKTSAGILFQR
jgi:hypothetical protein